MTTPFSKRWECKYRNQVSVLFPCSLLLFLDLILTKLSYFFYLNFQGQGYLSRVERNVAWRLDELLRRVSSLGSSLDQQAQGSTATRTTIAPICRSIQPAPALLWSIGGIVGEDYAIRERRCVWMSGLVWKTLFQRIWTWAVYRLWKFYELNYYHHRPCIFERLDAVLKKPFIPKERCWVFL